MRVSERLKNYIQAEIENGHLHPGDRLPSLRSLAEIIGANYVTVHTAMEKLQKERIVESNNRGTYLSGTNRLKVRLNIVESDISEENMRKLLNKHLANTELYLDFDIHTFAEITEISKLSEMKKSCPAAISISNELANPEDHLPASSLEEFSDYKKHLATLKPLDSFTYGTSLPFTTSSAGFGINRELMKQIGFQPEKIANGLGWWTEYAKKCTKAGIPPLALHWNKKQLFLIVSYYPQLLSSCGTSKEKYCGSAPLFDTPEGRAILKMIADTVITYDNQAHDLEFFRNRTPLALSIGSWISTQNNNPEYPEIAVGGLDIIPNTNTAGKRCYIASQSRLEAYFRKDLVHSEKKRVWELMKIMTSREFQLDYCGNNGMISTVKDIYPTEYYWNRSGKWNAFFPQPEDIVFSQKKLFNQETLSGLSAILEFFMERKISLDETAKLLDMKKEFPKC